MSSDDCGGAAGELPAHDRGQVVKRGDMMIDGERMQNPVAVTGIGVVSPVGTTAAASFDALVRGESGVEAWSDLDASMEARLAARVRGVDGSTLLGTKAARRLGRFTQLAAVAAVQAAEDAGLADANYDAESVGTVVGVGLGGLEALHAAALTLETKGPRRVSPFGIPSLIPNLAAATVAEIVNARGPSLCVSSACASSGHAIGEACQIVRQGRATAVLAGGAEACVHPLAAACFGRMGVLSRRNDAPHAASRPFDAQRDGFVLAEGAAVLVLEDLSAARARGARIYGLLAGYGATADAYSATRPNPDGVAAARAISGALADAGLRPDEVDYVNAHGTATQHADAAETTALKLAFKEHATKLWISSTKSMTGHMLGAAAAFEAVVSLLALNRSVVPPTINLERPDPACDLDYVPRLARERRLRAVISNSFGFGGQNVCLAFRPA